MKVKMLVDAPGSPDGVTVNEYIKDEVYEVSESLANAFHAHGLAEKIEAKRQSKKDAGPSENKQADAPVDPPAETK